MFALKCMLPLLCLPFVVSEYEHILTTYVNNTALLELYPEDARLGCSQLAAKYGYKLEAHEVVTEDGYIITLFRLPGAGAGKPLLMIHGVLDSADNWFRRGKESVGFSYADAGWDVWFGNFRGNRYGRRHRSLDPDRDPLFWNYSHHEFGYYDMAATVDYILARTKENQLKVVSHSLGTTSFLVLGSTRPEYNDKVAVLVSLAPIAYLHNAAGILITPAVASSAALNKMLNLLGQHELAGDNSITNAIVQNLCYNRPDVCAEKLIFPFAGFDREQVELEFYRSVMARYPSATSRKSLVHLAQTRVRRLFSQYDYGAERNLQVYGSENPSDYDIGKITMKVSLICSVNDGLSSIKDVEILRRKLPNVVDYYVIKNNKWNHADYVWGRDVRKYVTRKVFQILDKY